MSKQNKMVNPHAIAGEKSASTRRRWRRILVASTAALSLGVQDAAWAVCADGSTFPASGYAVGGANTTNWSPHTFTGTLV
jgi:hypothetical protein